jgi:hypothetical protein
MNNRNKRLAANILELIRCTCTIAASQCYEALHGCYAPASVKPRLFLDSGIELESFEGFEGGESILIVSSGEVCLVWCLIRACQRSPAP